MATHSSVVPGERRLAGYIRRFAKRWTRLKQFSTTTTMII